MKDRDMFIDKSCPWSASSRMLQLTPIDNFYYSLLKIIDNNILFYN